ncbi:MAG TPA: dockerin type I domain-containing protein [Ruminococcus flavefaciens]|nr:dockerin type I domain-containing protein [Ruminococcus flavefaciens]
MKLKRLTAALIAALTAITPFSFNSPAATVFAEGTGVVAALPDWIPSDFESAVEFRNTYGATHIDNGLICIVLLNEYSTPTNDFLRYDTVTTKNALDTVSRKVYSSDMTRTKLEVIVYSPLVQGDIEVDIVDTMIQAPSLDLGGRHASGYYTFTVDNNFNITETDIFSWLPDSMTEYGDYTKKNGEVSVKDNYVVFCTRTIDQFGDRWESNSTNKNEILKPILSSDCTMQVRDMYCDGSIDKIYVYQAVNDGNEKISWTRTSSARPDESMTYTLTADCAVFDNARSVLLTDTARFSIVDSETGKLVDIDENDKIFLNPDIRYSSGEEGIYASVDLAAPQMTSNPYYWDISQFKDADIFEVGLLYNNIPDGYSLDTAGTVVRKFDNGAIDYTYKLKSTPTGDVNDDGEFNVADAVLLQKWLLAVPDTHLVDWKAADFCNDNVLNVFDLCLMKQELTKKMVTTYVEPDERFEWGVPFYVVNDGLKLYSGPDESYDVIASIPADTRMTETGAMNGNSTWLFTEYNGQCGWIDTLDKDGKMVIHFEEATRKPVIYLYPERETDVHVELELTESELNTTYPKYDNGWDVTAYPDGMLLNKADGSHHKYLFWDAVNCRTRFDFSRGFCVAGSDTESFLKEKLTYMGLNEQEMNEFIVYWLPLMEHNAYNLISFQGDAYTNSAKLKITPTPDSECRVFMAYVPLENAVAIEPQQLETFERKGFSVVEWGGAEVNSFNVK